MKKPTTATALLLLGAPILLLAGCSSTLPSSDEQLVVGVDRKEWAMNIDHQPHTHVVTLPGCSEKPLTFTHVHQPYQMGVGFHRHNGCFLCPPKKAGVKRIRNPG